MGCQVQINLGYANLHVLCNSMKFSAVLCSFWVELGLIGECTSRSSCEIRECIGHIVDNMQINATRPPSPSQFLVLGAQKQQQQLWWTTEGSLLRVLLLSANSFPFIETIVVVCGVVVTDPLFMYVKWLLVVERTGREGGRAQGCRSRCRRLFRRKYSIHRYRFVAPFVENCREKPTSNNRNPIWLPMIGEAKFAIELTIIRVRSRHKLRA